MSDPLVAFLLEQIEEASEHLHLMDDFWLDTLDDHTGDAVRYFTDKDRIEREIESKREIIKQYEAMQGDVALSLGLIMVRRALEAVLRAMALPYADRPGYDPAWAPESSSPREG